MPRNTSNTRRRDTPKGFSADILACVSDRNTHTTAQLGALTESQATLAIYVMGLSAYARDLTRTAANQGLAARELPTAIPLVPSELAGPVIAARIAKEKALQQARIQRRRIESDFIPEEVVEDRLRRTIGSTTQGSWLPYVELDIIKPTRRTLTVGDSKKTVVYVEVDDELRYDGKGKTVAELARAARQALELPQAVPQNEAELLVPVVELDATYAQTAEWFNSHPQQRLPGYITLGNIAVL